jgi:hypothetical protein
MKYVQYLIIVLSVIIAASLLVKAPRSNISTAASMTGAQYEVCEARDWETEDGEEETEYC